MSQPEQCSITVSFVVEKEEVNERRADKPKYWRQLFQTAYSSSYNGTARLKQMQEDFPAPSHRITVYTTTSFTVKTTGEMPQLLMYQEQDQY